MKKPFDNKQNSRFILEELEPRQLFSAGIEGLLINELELPIATYITIDESGEQISTQQDQVSKSSTAEKQSHEIIFVDTGVDNYQVLVDDLLSNTDSNRVFEVVLLNSNQNGIEQISDTLLNHDELDTIHIISHGEDGNIQLGNTSLNANTLAKNQLAITLWADSFTESGDILIYGCNLAKTEIGQNLVDSLSQLTHTDVGASNDLTGNIRLGGDWELEFSTGNIEATIALSTELQQTWNSILAVTPSYTQRIQGGGISVDTVGMRTDDIFSGDNTPILNISTIPSGATVVDAFLYVNQLDNGTSDKTFTLNSNGITATEIGSSAKPDWLGVTRASTVKIDVSSIVTGNGNYILGGAGGVGGSVLYQGATLVVVYQDTSVTSDSIITLHEGSATQRDFPSVDDLNFDLSFNNGSALPTDHTSATATVVAFDSQTNFDENALTFQANSAGSATTIKFANSFNGDAGGAEQFDADITSLITQADSSATLYQQASLDNIVYAFVGTVIELENSAPTDIVIDSESASEQTVNTYGTSEQIDPAIAAFDDGGYIVVWVSKGQGGDGSSEYGIYGQRYNADGTTNGVEFLVTSETGDSETNPSVATFSDGGFVVTWQDQTSGVKAWTEARVFNADGTVTTADFLVSPGIDGNNEGYQSAVIALNANEFVAVWANEIGGTTYEVAGQVYDRNGTPVGSQFSLGSLLSGSGLFGAQTEVTRLDDGGFAVTWRTYDGSSFGTRARVMNADGSARSAQITLVGDNIADVAALSNGNFVVSYDFAGALKAVIYDANGVLVTAAFTVNTTTSAARYESSVTSSDDGFVVVWESNAGDGSGSAILAQRFDLNGNKIYGEIVVNQTVTGNQQKPEVIETTSGQVIAVWQSENIDAAATGIVTRIVTTGMGSVAEDAANGTRVADVIGVLDADIGDTHIFSLVDDADGRFAIDSNTGIITVANESLLVYANNSSHNITIQTIDSNGLTYDEVVTIQVRQPLNNVPTITQTTNEDTALVFNSVNNNLVSINDLGLSNDNLEVTLTVANGTLSLSQTTGLSFTTGNGTADASMTFTGTLVNINAALDGMSFTPTANYNGPVSLQITTYDDAGLVGAYSFEDTTNSITLGIDDGPGTANNGTLSGATSINDPTKGNVLNFDGVDDGVEINGLYSESANVTLSAWVNFTGAETGDVISIGDSVLIRAGDWGSNDGLSGLFYDGSNWQEISTSTAFSGTGWHHVAYTFDDTSDQQKLYIDGIEVASGTETTSIDYFDSGDPTFTNTTIGRHPDPTETLFFFDGMIDDARIYDRALTAVEITNIMNAPPGKDSDTVAITVNPVNNAPTLTALSQNPTYTEGDPAVNLFGFVTADPIESGQTIEELVFTVTNVTDDNNELINLDGSTFVLADLISGTTADNGYSYSVSLTGTMATVTLTTTGATTANIANLGGSLSYQNSSETPSTLNRVFTIINIKDSGGITNGGIDTSSPNLVSTVTVIAVNDVPSLSGVNTVFINEIHYDNDGADTGEAVEIAAPAGTDLTGWSLVFYNGGNGLKYATSDISVAGIVTDLGNGYKVVTISQSGIQNGDSDGIALVDKNNTVVQFISYEGVLTAVDGPAAGLTSIDIGVSESDTAPNDTPVGHSLQLAGSSPDFSWDEADTHSFGAENTNQSLSQQVDEDSTLTFSSTNNNALIISNVDADAGDLQVTLSVNQGILTLVNIGGGINNLSDNGTSNVSFKGTVTEINAALEGLKYKGNQDYFGNDTLTITVDDQGNTGSEGALNVTGTVAITVTPINDAPAGAITIDNLSPAEGNTLTVSNTLTDADGLSATISYQWYRDGSAITGATTTSYTTTQADVDSVLTVRASYTDDQNTNEAVTSTATVAVINVNNSPTGSVTLSGTATEDEILTAANTLADVDGIGAVSYQWQRNGTDISGATGSTYTLGDADVGTMITVVASYTDDQTTDESMNSAAVGPIANVNDTLLLANTVDDLDTIEGIQFSLTFPANTFIVTNNSNISDLTYTATLLDGSDLPSWLKFDASNRTFSGIPNNSDVGSIFIKLSANNGSSSISTDFILTVIEAPATITVTGIDTGIVTKNTPLTTGVLTISGNNNFIAETIYGTHGKFTIEESGIWSYSLYTSQDELLQLAHGDNINSIFQVSTADGFTHDIVISINGITETDDINNSSIETFYDSDPYFYTNITMTTQTENITTVSTSTAAEKPNATANKFVSNLNDEISQMLEELNSVSLDSADNSSWFDRPEYELDSYSTDYDEDESESVKSSQKQSQGLKNNLSSNRENLTIGKNNNFDENEDQALWNRIDNIRDQMDDNAASDNEKLEVKIALGSSIGLTAGVVSWFLRGGALLASFMSSIPFLNRFDPVPILKSKEKKPVRKASRKASKKTSRKSKR